MEMLELLHRIIVQFSSPFARNHILYTGGGIKKINLKDTFECTEITETHVVLRYLEQEEVIQKLGEKRNDMAENLVQQLLKIVTKDQAVKLIQHR